MGEDRLRSIKNAAMYMGLAKGDFCYIRNDVLYHNRKMINVGTIALSLIILVFICFQEELMTDKARNFILLNLLIFVGLSALTLVKNIPTEVLVAGWVTNLYALAISQDIMFLENQRAVISIASMFFTVILFYDVFYRIFICYSLGLFVALTLSSRYTSPYIHSMNRLNFIVFGMTCAAFSYYLSNQFARRLLSEKEIARSALYDEMTGVKNRNAFNRFVEEAVLGEDSVYCIYVDVNGLGELNNTCGHEEGDKMLRVVARLMKESFGEDIIYRIGGDEFVAFIYDGSDTIFDDIASFNRKIHREGYSVAIGFAASYKNCGIQELVKHAEKIMYEDKRRHYEVMMRNLK